jgi:hypothetical protein
MIAASTVETAESIPGIVLSHNELNTIFTWLKSLQPLDDFETSKYQSDAQRQPESTPLTQRKGR